MAAAAIWQLLSRACACLPCQSAINVLLEAAVCTTLILVDNRPKQTQSRQHAEQVRTGCMSCHTMLVCLIPSQEAESAQRQYVQLRREHEALQNSINSQVRCHACCRSSDDKVFADTLVQVADAARAS